MQPLAVRQADVRREGGCLGRRCAVHRGGRGQLDIQDDAAAGIDEAGRHGHPADALAVGHQHLREQARGRARDEIRVEGDQRLAGRHPIALAHARSEALAVQTDRVDADVNQNLDPLVGRDRQRMGGPVHQRDEPGSRGQYLARGRIDRDPVAHRALREHRVRDALEGHEDSGERREQADPSRHRAHGVGGGASGWACGAARAKAGSVSRCAQIAHRAA